MSLAEVIKNRKSVRNYSGEALKKEHINAINQYIATLEQPLGGNARIELISTNSGDKPVKLGTYGVISSAKDFLTLVYEPGPLAEENAGYLFEQVVLFCTSLGLGTCWLGGTLKKSDFAKQIQIKKDEIFSIVSPVGYPAEKLRFLDKLMRAGAKSDNRKPFETLFFEQNFETPLKMEDAGKYLQPLEMLRLAPSASNSQPWRIIKSDNQFHFYDHVKGRFSTIDLGIGLCHFGEMCKEMNIAGSFEILEENYHPQGKDNQYIISWIGD
jgi:nitroreductase